MKTSIQPDNKSHTRNLALLVLLSALGGLTSLLVGYAGRAVSSFGILPLVFPQLLTGFHVIWLTIAFALVRAHGSATFVGALKGLIETVFSSHLGPLAFLVSLTQGLTVDLVFIVLKKPRPLTISLASGLSAVCSLVIVQFLFWPVTPLAIILLAYATAFFSASGLSGYLTKRVMQALPSSSQFKNL